MFLISTIKKISYSKWVKFVASYSALPREALSCFQMCKTNLVLQKKSCATKQNMCCKITHPNKVCAHDYYLWENIQYLKLSDQNNGKFVSNKYYFYIKFELKLQLLNRCIIVLNYVSMQAVFSVDNVVFQNFLFWMYLE